MNVGHRLAYVVLWTAAALCLTASPAQSMSRGGSVHRANGNAPIRITSPEQARIDFRRTDGGLSEVSGAQTFVVFRADKEHPAQSDGLGWTYHHHPDIACWHGRLYVGWDSCERDEGVWPSRELYSTSLDGAHWSPPRELFPQGDSTALRMYFFQSPNGRMLAIAGMRVSHEKVNEKTKGPLIVREIRADQTLGPVFTLRAPQEPAPGQMPFFETATDTGFVQGCRQLLATPLYLEQQDYGTLLPPEERMAWFDPAKWTGSARLCRTAAGFGEALCFFRRADGTLVAVGKQGWVTLSHDNGQTWSQPVQPRTLVTGFGKVWGQQTPDGRYLLAYNPSRTRRYPLVVVTGDDGITYGNMQVVHGELPAKRYPGADKDPGASYVRGLSAWSDDGSRRDNAVWLVYSVNKEEIWVTRLPVGKTS